MTHIKRNKLTSNNKDTRWDRIRKRHGSANSANLKTETVKRFIEIDYVGKNQQNLMNGATRPENKLDPVLVMDLRHEMFKQIPRKLPLATVAYSKNLDICKSHNIAVEERYIENQLEQFRQHLQKQNKRDRHCEKKIHSLLIDNQGIMDSLETSQRHIEDFYNTPIEAFQQVHELFKQDVNQDVNTMENGINAETEKLQLEEEKEPTQEPKDLDTPLDEITAKFPEILLFDKNDEILSKTPQQRTPSPLANTDEVLQPLKENIEQNNGQHLRCVRFDEDVNICQFQRENSTCSNTSEGIDSVISELAEEALMELKLEEEEEKEKEPVKDESPNLTSKSETETTYGHAAKTDTPDNTLTLTACSSLNEKNTQGCRDLVIQGKIPTFMRRPIEDKHERKNVLFSITSTTTEDRTDADDLSSNHEQNKIIEELFETSNHSRITIMRRYFLKWLHFTHVEKIEREHVGGHADRVRKINIFLDKIRMEKSRRKKCEKLQQQADGDDGEFSTSLVPAKTNGIENLKINKKYQNKIKVQQDIIDLQRLKLERQERIIMELKLSKLSEEAREARMELKTELKSVIRSGDAKSKAKAKCLQLIGNLRDKEDERLANLQCKAMLMPKFLQSMQERALERSIKHEQARQRRLQKEAEREAQKMALEEAKRQEDEEAKRLRIEALKEKRRQEKMAKIIKERERQRYIENQRKAQEFYRRLLLKRIGMEGFKRLLQRKRDNLRRCEELRQSLYKRSYFQAWFSIYRISKARRCQKADDFYEHLLKRKYLHLWQFYAEQERSKYHVAVDYHELKLTESMFGKWFAYSKRMKMIEETKMKQATMHHEWHLKWKVLDCWQRLPQILQLEKETEERRQRWRMKIWELLPDYTPNRDELNFL
ncbi:calponin homology domain-containing protein DDB_G0272472 [Musca vetustissima]|uniref:calponin homology domain-containing protein DDB_G0272472 n=1 Tax=Musca vetustissima TaxID=27455 RepID=UPI002AB6E3A3|nr:calponin homology domain-containing protein DDB_G0272472 [Musca vetustissima]